MDGCPYPVQEMYSPLDRSATPDHPWIRMKVLEAVLVSTGRTAWLVGAILSACAGYDGSLGPADDRQGQAGRFSDGETTSQSEGASDRVDRDGDGLCDATEAGLGTDPDRLDSDGDRWPDLIELAFGFDPVSNLSPSLDHIVHLPGRPGATATLQPRVTVDHPSGTSETYSGRMSASVSLYLDGHVATDYVVIERAHRATPPDNVSWIDSEHNRFIGVRGRTRLTFELSFAYPLEDEPPPCTLAYAFDFSVTTSDFLAAAPTFLLVISPDDSPPRAEDFCVPNDCT